MKAFKFWGHEDKGQGQAIKAIDRLIFLHNLVSFEPYKVFSKLKKIMV